MFFMHELERTITLHPSFFGPHVQRILEDKLLYDVEGTIQDNYYIVCVTGEWNISKGRVIAGSAQAEYTMHYKAVVWRPFKGEVMDGSVSSVVESGFFVDIGPLSVFVAQSMIPSDIKYDGNATPPQWTDNGDQVIEKGTQIRVKIKGIRGELGSMFAIATIKETTSLNNYIYAWLVETIACVVRVPKLWYRKQIVLKVGVETVLEDRYHRLTPARPNRLGRVDDFSVAEALRLERVYSKSVGRSQDTLYPRCPPHERSKSVSK